MLIVGACANKILKCVFPILLEQITESKTVVGIGFFVVMAHVQHLFVAWDGSFVLFQLKVTFSVGIVVDRLFVRCEDGDARHN